MSKCVDIKRDRRFKQKKKIAETESSVSLRFPDDRLELTSTSFFFAGGRWHGSVKSSTGSTDVETQTAGLFNDLICGQSKAKWMWIVNFVAFCVHLSMGVTVVWQGEIASQNTTRLNLNVYDIVGNWHDPSANGYTYVMKSAGSVPLHAICGLFAFVSATFHFLIVAFTYGSVFRWKRSSSVAVAYYWGICNCCLYWRWIEYAISAPIMNVALFLVSGIRERTVLGLTGFMQSAVCLCGLLSEVQSQPIWTPATSSFEWTRPLWRRLSAVCVGLYLYVALWMFYLLIYYRNVDEARSTRELKPPAWVPFIVWAQILVFSLFTFPIVVYQCRHPKHYWQTELIYATLSLTAKTLLNGTLLANVIRLGGTDQWDVREIELNSTSRISVKL